MFIHVTRDLAVALEEPQDFKHFKLVIDATRQDATRIESVLAGIATIGADGHA